MPTPRALVLVVDDDLAFGGRVSELLGQKGFETAVFSDPVAALEAAGDGRFAAGVVDRVMPGTNGFELAERIRAKSPETQFVMLTEPGDTDSAALGLKVGIVDCLPKESMPVPLLEAYVARAVDRWRLLRDNQDLGQQLADSTHLLRVLQEIGTSLSGEAHLDRLLERLVAATRQLCGAEACRAMLFRRTHEAEGLLVETAVGDGADAVRGARLHSGEGLAALALDRDEIIDISKPSSHPRYSRRCDELPTSLPSFLAAPLHHGSTVGALVAAGREGGFSSDHFEIMRSLARQSAVAIDNALQQEKSVNFFSHVCDILVDILDGMDVHYPGHSRRVAAFSDMVTRRLGLPDEERRQVHFAGLLHDIGKVRLDPALLRGEGKLTAEKRAEVRRHPGFGVEMLRQISVWEDILPIILSHHERWDGRGYPRGIAGEEIPLGARVVALAEVFDAISRPGPHVPTRTVDEALAEIERCAGTQFDPWLAGLFVEEYRLHAEDIKV
ncbi:MAG: HD domain-containing phosphohydrolase [Vicinamibacteria bacterium]